MMISSHRQREAAATNFVMQCHIAYSLSFLGTSLTPCFSRESFLSHGDGQGRCPQFFPFKHPIHESCPHKLIKVIPISIPCPSNLKVPHFIQPLHNPLFAVIMLPKLSYISSLPFLNRIYEYWRYELVG